MPLYVHSALSLALGSHKNRRTATLHQQHMYPDGLFHTIVGSRSKNSIRVSRPQPSRRASSSAVFSRMSASFPRDSTLSRTSGSVFEPRRLKRQSANSTDRPSVKSTDRAFFS